MEAICSFLQPSSQNSWSFQDHNKILIPACEQYLNQFI